MMKVDKELEKVLDDIKRIMEREVDEIILNEFEFNYKKSLVPLNGNGNQETDKIITGQVFLFDFKNRKITIIDEKKYKNHFARKKTYGPYPYEKLGFSKDIALLIKIVLFSSKNNITNVKCLNFPKYVIANRNMIVQNGIDNKEFENALILWGVTENNYRYEEYKELYDKLCDFMIEGFRIFSSRNSNYKEVMEKYESIMKGE